MTGLGDASILTDYAHESPRTLVRIKKYLEVVSLLLT